MLAITKVTGSHVTFVNPSDSSKEYTVTWNEFKKIGVASVSCSYF